MNIISIVNNRFQAKVCTAASNRKLSNETISILYQTIIQDHTGYLLIFLDLIDLQTIVESSVITNLMYEVLSHQQH